MPPIMLTRDELSSLRRIVERARPLGDVPPDHTEKFINYGLVSKDIMILRATQLGQVELLRQRFRGMDAASPRLPYGTPVAVFR